VERLVQAFHYNEDYQSKSLARNKASFTGLQEIHIYRTGVIGRAEGV
jgi:hypothetical protein